MSSHLTDRVIAKANAVPINPEEGEDTGEPRVLHLYLEEDDRYRWYHEDGEETEAAGDTIHDALAAGRMAWTNFELMEYRGRLVEPETEETIANVYASDEAEKVRRREAPSQPGA